MSPRSKVITVITTTLLGVGAWKWLDNYAEKNNSRQKITSATEEELITLKEKNNSRQKITSATEEELITLKEKHTVCEKPPKTRYFALHMRDQDETAKNIKIFDDENGLATNLMDAINWDIGNDYLTHVSEITIPEDAKVKYHANYHNVLCFYPSGHYAESKSIGHYSVSKFTTLYKLTVHEFLEKYLRENVSDKVLANFINDKTIHMIPDNRKTEKLYSKMIDAGHDLRLIPEDKLSKKICVKYARKNPKKIMDIPINMLDKDFYLEIIRENYKYMKYIDKNIATELFHEAVVINPKCLKYSHNFGITLTPEMC